MKRPKTMHFGKAAAVTAAAGLALLLASGAAANLEADLAGTKLLYSFVIIRHGDRTPEPYELAQFPKGPKNLGNYYAYGYGQLTNTGKQRAFAIGKYLRSRYDGFLDSNYLPDQISVSAMNVDRTKMTALAALAALYPPTKQQLWNPKLPWQPIPYDIKRVPNEGPSKCYKQLFEKLLARADIKAKLSAYSDLFKALSKNSGADIKTPTTFRQLLGAVLGNKNYGVDPPAWFKERLPKIEELRKLTFQLFFYNDELTRTYAGPLLNKFLEDAAAAAGGGGKEASPRVRVLSAHGTTVASLMSAARVFTSPHQPAYGAAFSLELRKNIKDGKLYVAPVYWVGGDGGQRPDAARVLRVPGCGSGALCPLDTFVKLTNKLVLKPADEAAMCPKR